MEFYPQEGFDAVVNDSSDDFVIAGNNIFLLENGQRENYSVGIESNGTNITYNGTLVIWDPRYPSGYTIPHIILASVIATILMIIVVVGNMLVIIAIATEKALKNIQNWFIASLAVADFFLGLIIMPFSLANELMGYWIFGNWWCDIHSAMDVLLCTASIMNLCLISLDRYWSITQAVDYLKKRTPARAAVMITLVWILSGLICIPPLLGWKVDRPFEQFPKCQVSDELGYVLYSALGSFYIPSCIMVFVYIRIYFAAKARARRGIRKSGARPQTAAARTGSGGANEGQHSSTSFTVPPPQQHGQQISTIVTTEHHSGTPGTPAIPIVTCDLASDLSTSDPAPPEDPTVGIYLEESAKKMLLIRLPKRRVDSDDGERVNKDTLKVSASLPPTRPGGLSVPGAAATPRGSINGELVARARAPSVAIDADMVSEFDPSSSDSGVVSRCAVVKPLKLRLCQPIFGRRSGASKSKRRPGGGGGGGSVSGGGSGSGSRRDGAEDIAPSTPTSTAPPKVHKPRDPEREKRRIARKKEKRATLILGLIMGSFIACWLPFFFLYILTPLCPACAIPDFAFSIAFWLGYMNSALNPVIYTIFNKDFRRAFRRILFK